MKTRILARVLVYDEKTNKILLVRNNDASFWYIPGGGWEYERENILECGVREIKEETGLDVEIKKFLFLQEYHENKESIFFETIWLANVKNTTELNDKHVDLDPNGKVEEVKWFSKEELIDKTVYPKILKDFFWDNLKETLEGYDRFIGVN